MVKNKSSFGFFLKEKRLERNLTLKQLAELSGLSTSYLSRVERGQRNIPKAGALKKIAPYLGLSILDMMIAAGYLPGTEVNIDEGGLIMDKGDSNKWLEIVKDPEVGAAFKEIGRLNSEEKQGLLIYLKAIKLKRTNGRE